MDGSNVGRDPSLKQCLKGHKDVVTDLDFSPDASQLVSTSLDGTVMVWNLKSQRVMKFVGHKAGVLSARFNPAGSLIATGSADATVKLWENSHEGTSTTIRSHSAAVRSVSFSFDGQYLLSGSDDKHLKIFHTASGKHLSTIRAHNDWIREAEFSPDSRLIVSGSDDKTFKLWDAETTSLVAGFEEENALLATRFHPDGTSVATGAQDGKVALWDIRSKLLLQSYPMSHSDACTSVAFHTSGRYLVSASQDASLKIYDLRMGQAVYGHQGSANVVNFSSDGTQFCTGGADSDLILWNSNLVDPEQDQEVEKVKQTYKASRRAMEGEEDVKPKKFTRRYKLGKTEKKEAPAQADKENVSGNVPNEKLPEDMAGMMDKIVSQLDIVTRTVCLQEKRMSDWEGQIDRLYELFKQHKASAEEKKAQ